VYFPSPHPFPTIFSSSLPFSGVFLPFPSPIIQLEFGSAVSFSTEVWDGDQPKSNWLHFSSKIWHLIHNSFSDIRGKLFTKCGVIDIIIIIVIIKFL